MKVGQAILKLFTPRAEEARMSMREARCHAEASAEDLTRTVALHEGDIKRMIRAAAQKKMGGRA